MTIYQAVLSGIIQGLTEFLPISSSGHLVILHHYFGFRESQILFDLFLHLGTLLAIILVFWHDIITLFTDRKIWGVFVIAASLPAAIVAFLFADLWDGLFVNVRFTGAMLIVTGIWLAAAQNRLRRRTVTPRQQLTLGRALIIGIAQGAALLPGISRSGATISTGILSGLKKEKAVIFSFLLAIPATFGALLFKIREAANITARAEIVPFLAGSLAAMLIGILAIKFLFKAVNKGRLYIFSIYCIVIGLTVIILGGFNNG